MNTRASASVIILVLLILISLALAGGGFYLLQQEKARSAELEKQLDDTKTEQRRTELRLKDSEKTVADLKSELQQKTTQIDKLNVQLQQETTGRQSALSQIGQLKADLEQQKRSRSDLENQLQEAQDNLRKMQASLSQLEALKKDFEAKIKELEEKSQGVELGKIVVGPEGTLMQSNAAPGLEGKVLVVNKEYDFAVIGLGSQDGVRVGDVFAVYHNDKYLGDVAVEKVHDSMAAAGFSSPDLKSKLNEGDRVVQKVK